MSNIWGESEGMAQDGDARRALVRNVMVMMMMALVCFIDVAHSHTHITLLILIEGCWILSG